jgi:hypothetical protein
MTPQEIAIVRSVVYASLFEYPLTLDQLHASLLQSSQTRDEILETYRTSPLLQTVIEHQDGLFFPRGRGALVMERRLREARSHAFLAVHRRLLRIVCGLPHVRMVALSDGSTFLAERFCRWAYGTYLRAKSGSWRSPDQVRLEDGCLKLHTRSHRHATLERFDRAVWTAIDQGTALMNACSSENAGRLDQSGLTIAGPQSAAGSSYKS